MKEFRHKDNIMYNSIYIRFYKRPNSRDRNQISSFQGLGLEMGADCNKVKKTLRANGNI